MTKTDLKFNDDCRNGLRNGINKLCNTVATTLGPGGRNVIIDKENSDPVITKDGVTVAKSINLVDPLENMGAKLIKTAAQKTADESGDGTTTTCVLANTILNKAYQAISNGYNPVELKRGMDVAVNECVKILNKQKNNILDTHSKETIQQVATISANNDQSIGELVANAFDNVGVDGIISVEEGNSLQTQLTIVDGCQFNRGYLSQYFVTNDDKQYCEMQDNSGVRILITDKQIISQDDIVPIIEKVCLGSDPHPLLIMADKVDGQALATMIVNKLRGVISVPICAVALPGYGSKRKEIIQDIAILTDATLISDDTGYKLSDIKNNTHLLGLCNKIVVTKDNTTIIDGAGDAEKIKQRVDLIKSRMNDADISDLDKDDLAKRLARISAGVAVIRVGGGSDVEMKEIKDRIDDAVCATKSAIEEGVCKGGGMTYNDISNMINIDDTNTSLTDAEKVGFAIIQQSLKQPFITICENNGENGDAILERLLHNTSIDKSRVGYNAKTHMICDMYNDGIIDPIKVIRTALQNAESVASTIITSESSIINIPEDKSLQKMINSTVMHAQQQLMM